MLDNPLATELLAKIKAHDALVGIIGMGYVGLPLALAFVEKGFPVLGLDVDPDKVAKLNRGEGYIKHLDGGRIAAAVATGRFTSTADFSRLGEADAVLICVPTPLTPQREPDMTYVEAAAHQARATLRPGQLINFVSTTYPGTTDKRFKSILESSTFASPIVRNGPQRRDERSKTDHSLAPLAQDGKERRNVDGDASRFSKHDMAVTAAMNSHPEGAAPAATEGAPQVRADHGRCGTDFFLAFSPEREDPSNRDVGTTNIPAGRDATAGFTCSPAAVSLATRCLMPSLSGATTLASAKTPKPIAAQPRKHARRVVEAAHRWFNRLRKLLVRFEKLHDSCLALVHLAAAIICFRKAVTIYGYLLRRRCNEADSVSPAAISPDSGERCLVGPWLHGVDQRF